MEIAGSKQQITGKGNPMIGRWTLIAKVDDYFAGVGKRKTDEKWLAVCACGTQKVVLKKNVETGKSKSCGCVRKEVSATVNISHGQTGSKTYKIWAGMKRRCYNQNEQFYSHYGGRGIEVCEAWRDSFETFLSDMGECPDGYSIERINVNGNYEPTNCKWIPLDEQSRNTRKSKLTKAAAISIVQRKDAGESSKQLATAYSVDKTMIDKIVRGECWSDAALEARA